MVYRVISLECNTVILLLAPSTADLQIGSIHCTVSIILNHFRLLIRELSVMTKYVARCGVYTSAVQAMQAHVGRMRSQQVYQGFNQVSSLDSERESDVFEEVVVIVHGVHTLRRLHEDFIRVPQFWAWYHHGITCVDVRCCSLTSSGSTMKCGIPSVLPEEKILNISTTPAKTPINQSINQSINYTCSCIGHILNGRD